MIGYASQQKLHPRLLLVGGLATFAVLLMIGAPGAPEAQAQIATPARSPIAVGEKLMFEVASVRQNKSDGQSGMNVDPTPGDNFLLTGGLYSAQNVVLAQYIAFAYNLSNQQLRSLVSQVPWTTEDRFDIEARAEGNPTKDQYRMMMRSLLADRFRLAVHFETRQVPVYALVLAKPGKLGPQLRLHQAGDPLCAPPSNLVGSDSVSVPKPAESEEFPDKCGGIRRMKTSAPGRMRSGGRDVSMALIASILTGVGVVDRPMVDKTGLKGTVDFSLEWIQVAANVPANAEFHPDESAPSFDQAMKEQLGIRMVSEKGPLEFFVVDHLEHPSPN